MKRFKVTISNPAGEAFVYFWGFEQAKQFTGMSRADMRYAKTIDVTFDDGAYYKVEEDK